MLDKDWNLIKKKHKVFGNECTRKCPTRLQRCNVKKYLDEKLNPSHAVGPDCTQYCPLYGLWQQSTQYIRGRQNDFSVKYCWHPFFLLSTSVVLKHLHEGSRKLQTISDQVVYVIKYRVTSEKRTQTNEAMLIFIVGFLWVATKKISGKFMKRPQKSKLNAGVN